MKAMKGFNVLAFQEKMYASSCFYAPTHPTVEDQVELARRISYSLSDVKNMKSKGQSMYVNRKKRSVKWIHDGNGNPLTIRFATFILRREQNSSNIFPLWFQFPSKSTTIYFFSKIFNRLLNLQLTGDEDEEEPSSPIHKVLNL